MHRRAILVAGISGLVLPRFADAQAPQKVFRVAFLGQGPRTPDGGPPPALRAALKELGYVEGRNLAFECRYAEAVTERLTAMAVELVGLKPDAIMAQGGNAIAAARRVTAVIPIVSSAASGDLVAVGLIASPARPGGNVTGLTDEIGALAAKRMQILKEVVPGAARIAVIWNADDQGMTVRYREIEKAAQVLKVDVQALAVRRPEDFGRAISVMTSSRPDAVFLVADGLTFMNRKQIIEFAAAQRIPAMYETSGFVNYGGLLSYGPSLEEGQKRAAAYLDRIFKGAKPAELPAEYPARYYLTVNLKTAETLGLPLPPALLFRADDVIK